MARAAAATAAPAKPRSTRAATAAPAKPRSTRATIAAPAKPRTAPSRAPSPARRRSGPAAPRTAPRNAPAPAARPLGQILAARGTVLLDRLLQGRAWVGLIGVLLAGIVFLNVGLLQLNDQIARIDRQSGTVGRENAALRVRLGRLDSTERIQQLAEAKGFVMPAPGAVRYLRSRASDARNAARRTIAPEPRSVPVPVAPAPTTATPATPTSTPATPTPTPAAGTTPPAAPATTAPAAAQAPAAAVPAPRVP